MADSEFSVVGEPKDVLVDAHDEVPIEVSFSCQGLPQLEMTGSCMSVFAVLWLYNRNDRRWQEHGRTEVVRHGDAPAFARSFYLHYVQNNNPVTYEATDQWVRVQVFQRNSYAPCTAPLLGLIVCLGQSRCDRPLTRPTGVLTTLHGYCRSTLPNLSNHILHGQVKFTLRELYRTPIKAITRPLVGKPNRGHVPVTTAASDPGHLVARVVAVGDTSGYAECAVRAHNLTVTGVARDKCSPFLVVSRYCNMAGEWEVIHRSAKVTNNELDPLWPRFEASMHRVCTNDRDTYLRIEVWNDEASGQHSLLGQAETSVAGILSRPFDSNKTAAGSSGAAEHGKAHLELSTGSTGQPAAHIRPKRSKTGSMRLPPNKAVVTIELIVHSGAATRDKAGFDATKELDGVRNDGPLPQRESTTSTSAATGSKAARRGRRRRLQLEQPSYRQDDIAFLQDLMMDDVVRESDVKDIVGDGLRYLNELSTEAEAEAEALAEMSSRNRVEEATKAEAKRKRRQAQRRQAAKGRGGAPAARDMDYTVHRPGVADPESGIGQFLEPKLVRDPQAKLKIRKQKRLGLRRSFAQPSIGAGGTAARGEQHNYDRTDSVLARARAFVGEQDEDDQHDEHPNDSSSTIAPRPLSLPALHIGSGDEHAGILENRAKIKGPRWREQAKGGKNLRLNVTRKFKALTAPVFDEIDSGLSIPYNVLK